MPHILILHGYFFVNKKEAENSLGDIAPTHDEIDSKDIKVKKKLKAFWK